MKRWFILITLTLAIIGCAQTKPTPTPTATALPTLALAPTATLTSASAPSSTPLPPSPTAEPSDTPAPSDTPGPTSTATATATRTRIPFTPPPKATATNTAVALKYPAPQLAYPGAPGSRDSFTDPSNDLRFQWHPIANLDANECYQITVWVINILDQRYSPFTQILQPTCNSALSGGDLQFTLNRPKYGPPNYGGLVADAQLFTPSSEFRVRWWITVVRSDGTPLSPPSAQFEFTLNSP